MRRDWKDTILTECSHLYLVLVTDSEMNSAGGQNLAAAGL